MLQLLIHLQLQSKEKVKKINLKNSSGRVSVREAQAPGVGSGGGGSTPNKISNNLLISTLKREGPFIETSFQVDDDEITSTNIAPFEIEETLEQVFDDNFEFKKGILEVRKLQKIQKSQLEVQIQSLKTELSALFIKEIENMKQIHESEIKKLKNQIDSTNQLFEEKTVKTTEELNQFKLKKLEEEKFNLKVDFDEIKKNYETIKSEFSENRIKYETLLSQRDEEILELKSKYENEIKNLNIQNEMKLKKQQTRMEMKQSLEIENLKKDFEIHLSNFKKQFEQEKNPAPKPKQEQVVNQKEPIKNVEPPKGEKQEIEVNSKIKSFLDDIKSNTTETLDLINKDLNDSEVNLILFAMVKNTSIKSINFTNNPQIKGNFISAFEKLLLTSKTIEEFPLNF
jgi:hypothetical protein